MRVPSGALLGLLVAILCLSIAGGCGQEQRAVKLRVAINAGPEGDAVRSLADDYEPFEVEIVELPYQSLREQLIHALGDADPDFDVVMLDDPWFPQLAPHLVTMSDVPSDLLEDIVEASLKLGRSPYGTGEIRALPFVGNVQLLFFRRDILADLGISDLPDQWGDLARIATEISGSSAPGAGERISGYAIRGRSGAPVVTDFLPIYWSFGGRLVDNPGHPTREAIDEKLFSEALRLYDVLRRASPPGAENFDWSEMTAAFTNGQAVYQLNWPAAIPTIEKALAPESDGRRWDVALPPGNGDNPGTSMIGNWLLAVPSDSPNIDRGVAFIVWLMEQQGRVAGSGNPPTRVSVFRQLASEPGAGYFNVIREALEKSTPRPRTERWAEIENAVSQAVSKYLAGSLGEDEAAKLVKTRLEGVFGAGG